ncbi:MAG: alpha-2-macroglobulin, partial [Planctomycetia bacterium]
VKALTDMQLSDGGWGWFSGFGEQSWPHTTAVVVHGLQIAREHDIGLPAQMLERGIAWLKAYQEKQVDLIRRAEAKTLPYKSHADDLDALVYMILLDADISSNTMLEYPYRDRVKLSAYAKAVYGIALHKQKQDEKLAMILQNLGQFLVRDKENQTAYLQLPQENAWWYWHGSDTEANAWYLKLLARTDPMGEVAPALAKYLLNNRKHATYWNSTRDTSYCIEALAEFFKASGEDKPDMTVEILLDGRKVKEVTITPEDLFTFENQAVILGDAVESGEHKLEIRRKGKGPLYFNAYLTVFTLETPIQKAGLEVKVNRKYYLLKKSSTEVKAPDARGQVVNQRGEKWERTEIPD